MKRNSRTKNIAEKINMSNLGQVTLTTDSVQIHINDQASAKNKSLLPNEFVRNCVTAEKIAK